MGGRASAIPSGKLREPRNWCCLVAGAARCVQRSGGVCRSPLQLNGDRRQGIEAGSCRSIASGTCHRRCPALSAPSTQNPLQGPVRGGFGGGDGLTPVRISLRGVFGPWALGLVTGGGISRSCRLSSFLSPVDDVLMDRVGLPSFSSLPKIASLARAYTSPFRTSRLTVSNHTMRSGTSPSNGPTRRSAEVVARTARVI